MHRQLSPKHTMLEENAYPIISSCLPRIAPLNPCRARPATGEVAEWSNAAVLKTVGRESVPRVRIPVSPPAVLFSVNTVLFCRLGCATRQRDDRDHLNWRDFRGVSPEAPSRASHGAKTTC